MQYIGCLLENNIYIQEYRILIIVIVDDGWYGKLCVDRQRCIFFKISQKT